MPFVFSEQHITDYYHPGYTIYRGILLPRLAEELREAGEELQEISKEVRGPDVARSPVIGAVEERFSTQALQAFQHYRELPALVDTVHGVLSQEHTIDGFDNIALFFAYPVHPI